MAYNQAKEKYLLQEYEESLALTENALAKAQGVTPANRAYILQLLTSSCLMANNPDKGLLYAEEEIYLFIQAEGEKSKSLAEAKKKRILFMQQTGMVHQALEEIDNTLKTFELSWGNQTLPYTSMLLVKGDLTLSAGDSISTKMIWDDCLERVAVFSDPKVEYEELLLNSAALDENLGKKNSAKKKYESLVQMLTSEKQTTMPIYKEAKEAIARLENEKDVPDNFETFLKNALALQRQKQFEKAKIIYQQADAKATQFNVKTKTVFSIYVNYAQLLMQTGSFEQALTMNTKAAQLGASVFQHDSFENFIAGLQEADITLGLGKYSQAVEKYNVLSRVTIVGSRQQLTPYLLSSAELLLNNAIPETAARLLKPLVCCQPADELGSFLPVVVAYCDAQLDLNHPDSVLIFLSQPKFSNTNISLELIKIEALEMKGQWIQALAQLKSLEVLPISIKEKGAISYQIARVSQALANYTDAESHYTKAIDLFGKSSEDAWLAANSLSTLYLKLGNYTKSEQILKDLLDDVPRQNQLHITLLQNLTSNYIESNKIQKAKSVQEEIIAHERNTVGENHPDYALAIGNLAILLQKEGNFKEARKFFENALQISKNIFGDQSIDYAIKETNLAINLKDIGDNTHASIYLLDALTTLKRKLGQSHPDYVQCEYNLAMVYKHLGKVDLSIPLMQHAAEFYQKQVLDLFPAMNEQEQVAFYNKINRSVQDYIQFAVEVGTTKPDLIGQLFDFRLVTKALLLNSSIKTREHILHNGDTQLKNQFLQWLSLKDQLAKLYSEGKINQAQWKDQVASLESQTNDLEKKLSIASAHFKNDKDERDVSWMKIKPALLPGEAAIEFIRLHTAGQKDSISYAALVVRSDQETPQLIVFPNGRHMEGKEFKYYRNSILLKQLNERSFNIFWRPLTSLLNGIQTIYISADGVYNKLNLLTLYDPGDRAYLSNKYKIILLSNLHDIIVERPLSPSPKNASLFGYADFGVHENASMAAETSGPVNGLASVVSKAIPKLPGTRTEIEKIQTLLTKTSWGSHLYVGKEASEKNVKGLTPSKYIHIATHGFFIESSENDEQIVFSSNQENQNNPLLKSGLILSDIAKTTEPDLEDGMLTAYEVKNLNLENTDLVVLSACETGSGEIRNGEGVYGLQRSFQLSGVRNILMSLWKVDDQATQELMVLFYEKLLSTGNKVNSLIAAQNDLMKKYPDPYYWGSFVLLGKP